MTQESKTFSTRVSQNKLELWKSRVENFNAWVVSALESQFALDEAERRELLEAEAQVERSKQERLEELKQTYPQLTKSTLLPAAKRKCPHGVDLSARICKLCT